MQLTRVSADSVVVTLEGNTLMLQLNPGQKVPLFAESETYFFRRNTDGDSPPLAALPAA